MKRRYHKLVAGVGEQGERPRADLLLPTRDRPRTVRLLRRRPGGHPRDATAPASPLVLLRLLRYRRTMPQEAGVHHLGLLYLVYHVRDVLLLRSSLPEDELRASNFSNFTDRGS